VPAATEMIEKIEHGVIIDATLDDDVDLYGRKSRLFGCSNSLHHLAKVSAPTAHGSEDLFIKTIQANRDAMQARIC